MSMPTATVMTTAPGAGVMRAPAGDIPSQHWQGGPVNCGVCCYADLRALPDVQGCEPGHACMQDAYARRIDRFFRWHPSLGDEQLTHAYFEVRAIAARHASVFRLTPLIDDPDETVRLQIALRLPLTQLARLANDPHREVRIRVAQRLAPLALATLRGDPDYGVRELVALRLPLAILPTMAGDPDRAVRMRVAQRLEMPALLRMADDIEPEVRRVVAERLPAPLLSRMASDADWRVRWEVAQRADAATLDTLHDDDDAEVRQAVRERQARDAAFTARCGRTPSLIGVVHG
ncbi:4Fe4S-binding leucine-rich repeat protein [Rhodoferax sp.]|uniref:4Fe4S-binding leucine-rich repeat protein n=1 Tax=Rhodoferax sp. TaxID=50421 RepID=UPI0027232029|nr:4Fe4S-binding leucine-rich repeat protein [Rhodoferax sp.]MDO9199127.1 4Fe4S-binding leucine-rich repeat protein [Rhodoferax sp.]